MPGEMFKLSKKEGIIVKFWSLPEDILGAYFRRGERSPVIILEEFLELKPRLLRCIFAEELGHHFTTAFDLLAFARECQYMYMKYEKLALWWAAKYLLPWEKIKEAVYKGYETEYDLARHFYVTERFVGTSLKLYREKGYLFF